MTRWLPALVGLFVVGEAAGCASRGVAPVGVLAAGDLALGPRAPANPLEDLSVLTDGRARLRFVNLESPLAGAEAGLDGDGHPLPGATVKLAAPPDRAAFLAGRFDVASLANNHALDQGEAGRAATVAALDRAGVVAVTERRGSEVWRAGRRVIFVAASLPPGVGDGEGVEALVRRVELARRAPSDVVLVSLHWGHTGSLLPDAAQRRLAARLVDAGATAVLGHGPHAPQGVERRGRAIVAYSLGDLAFDCRCSEAKDAALITFSVDGDGRAGDVRLLPLAPGRAGGAARLAHDRELAALLADLSRQLGSNATVEGDAVRIP